MKPPTISEDEEAEKAAEAGIESAFVENGIPDTADKEVAEWVKAALEKKRAGKLAVSKKPALHEAPLDAVPGSPLLTKTEAEAEANAIAEQQANPGTRVDSLDLLAAKVQGLDFAA